MTESLYQAAILELAKQARGDHRLSAPEVTVTIDNPLCGDRVTLDLTLRDGRVAAIGHGVRGCLLCSAAAVVIAARAPGETAAALRAQADHVARSLTEAPAALGKPWPELAAFAPVHQHKSRHRCVLLPFQALLQALDRAAPKV